MVMTMCGVFPQQQPQYLASLLLPLLQQIFKFCHSLLQLAGQRYTSKKEGEAARGVSTSLLPSKSSATSFSLPRRCGGTSFRALLYSLGQHPSWLDESAAHGEGLKTTATPAKHCCTSFCWARVSSSMSFSAFSSAAFTLLSHFSLSLRRSKQQPTRLRVMEGKKPPLQPWLPIHLFNRFPNSSFSDSVISLAS